MRRHRVVAVLALVSALVSACAETMSSTPRARLTAKDIVQRASPAIVRIEAGSEKIGTGFILDKTGVVATNLHVVVGESAIKIKLSDGSQYAVTQIDGVDPARDLALLQIRAGKDLPTLKLGDSSAMSAGDQVVAIGNPLGFDNSVTSGLISQVRPICGPADIAAQKCTQELTVLQISAAISPGSSGGPLFNQYGEVVGVTTAIITAGQNFNLAVPGHYLKPLVAQRIAMSPDQFAKQTQEADEHRHRERAESSKATGDVPRHIPVHEITVFDGCKLEDIEDLVNQIGETIETGAPLYNQGNHEACFRIYEGTAVKFEHDGPCAGVRGAFGDGLLRASGLASYTEKAWAMRDTFDGLLDAARRWAEKHPQSAPGGRPPKKK
ncbi:MAG TPA: trypsin-like peptidase domain-containing protein [Kofleriaceae bacterium]|nr:trypsin-like peptidase domain-containing protein [Kofleriaceae bacterium]